MKCDRCEELATYTIAGEKSSISLCEDHYEERMNDELVSKELLDSIDSEAQ